MDKQAYLQKINEIIANGQFKDAWESLSAFTPPRWMQDAKFGIFIHWGPFSVPAYHDWYARNMYIKDSPEYEHHIKTYGKDFGYKDFIPMLAAENFNPDEWATLIKNSGAGYVVPVAEHHDGFQMYRSELSRWNAYEMGPKRDTLGELLAACDKQGIVRGASSHRLEHWFFFGHGKQWDSDVNVPLTTDDLYWPAMPEPPNQDLFGNPAPSQEYLEDWLLRCCEIVDKYRPQIFYFDWWIQHNAAKPYVKKFAAYYYNRAMEWGFEPAITYKHDAFMFGSAVVEIERGKFSDIQPFFWQTDTAVAKNSWCYSINAQYKKAKTLICDLADIVSKNGALLLNIGPKPDGTIPDTDKAILTEIGDWLRINGEAIYGTSVWRKAAEGPTQTITGQFTDGNEQEFTAQDIRFTVKGSYLYAIVLKAPEDGKVSIRSLAESGDTHHLPVFHGIVKNVTMLGGGEELKWVRDANGLNIEVEPATHDLPVVFKILLD